MSLAISPSQHKYIVLSTYRHLIRAINIAFRDDIRVRSEAQARASIGFREPIAPVEGSGKVRLPSTWKEDNPLMIGTPQVGQRIEHAQSVTKILLENVVQGRQSEEGDRDKYKLRITKYTQRHDNEDTKKLKGTTKSFKEIKTARF